MQTGWQRISGTWYFLDSSGKWISDISAKLNEITKYTYVPYVSGGTSTSGWDCSGFTQWAMKQMGVSIPRTAAEQSKVGKSISVSDKSQWKPGDLLYFKMNGRIGHAALYLGNGQMMHALNPRYGTYITSVDAYCKWDKQNVLTYVKRVL